MQEQERDQPLFNVRPLMARAKEQAPRFKREKNWGFVEEDGALMIYYALLPCTVVLEFDTGQPDGVLMRGRTCYDAEAAAIEQHTGTREHLPESTGCCHFGLHAVQQTAPEPCEAVPMCRAGYFGL